MKGTRDEGPQYASVNGVRIRYQLFLPPQETRRRESHISDEKEKKKKKEREKRDYKERRTPFQGHPCRDYVVAFTPGGRGGGIESTTFSKLKKALIAKHVPVLSWDRRNSGLSEINFDFEGRARAEVDAEDLHALVMGHLGFRRVGLAGQSAGGRMCLAFVEKYPECVARVMLKNLTGGEKAARNLSQNYYDGPLDLAREMGMAGIAHKDKYYSKLLTKGPPALQTRRQIQLLSTDVNIFASAMMKSRNFLWRAVHPVLGFSATKLVDFRSRHRKQPKPAGKSPTKAATQPACKPRAISDLSSGPNSTLSSRPNSGPNSKSGKIPFLLVFDRRHSDGMHTREVMQALSRALEDAPLLEQTDAKVWVPRVAEFFLVETRRMTHRSSSADATGDQGVSTGGTTQSSSYYSTRSSDLASTLRSRNPESAGGQDYDNKLMEYYWSRYYEANCNTCRGVCNYGGGGGDDTGPTSSCTLI